MKSLFLIICMGFSLNFYTQTAEQNDIKAIETVIENQRIAWNNFNIEGFMEGYWKSDDLKFYGSSGITHGWQNTLNRYKKNYPTKAHTGKLTFKINSITPIQDESYYVMGEYFLKRDTGDANGIFMIIFKKIDGKWKIIADTSC